MKGKVSDGFEKYKIGVVRYGTGTGGLKALTAKITNGGDDSNSYGAVISYELGDNWKQLRCSDVTFAAEVTSDNAEGEESNAVVVEDAAAAVAEESNAEVEEKVTLRHRSRRKVTLCGGSGSTSR